jgi:large subunit ribosomal protein L21
MYAIVETGGKQYRVKPGDTVAVERLATEPGETLDLERVLLVGGNGEAPRIGTPGVSGAVVRAEVVEHMRGDKIVVFRYKSKVRYRRKTGHRQALTRLRITDIVLDGKSSALTAEPEAAPATQHAPAAVQLGAPEPTGNVLDAAEAPVEEPTPAAAEEAVMPASAGEGEPGTEDDDNASEQGA